MLNLSDLASTVLQIVTTFLIVSYISSAITGAFDSVFKWSANMLFQGVKELLNDPMGQGLALAIYGDARVHPLGPGKVKTEIELRAKPLPSSIDPAQFADAMIDYLELRDVTIKCVERSKVELTEQMENMIEKKLPDPQLQELVKDLLNRDGTDLALIHKDIAAWFDLGMARVTGRFIRRTQLSTFLVALAIAAMLDLQPWPLGSKADGANDPFAYIRTFFEWLIVAASTLFGAPFWYSILAPFLGKKSQQPPSPSSESAPPPAAPLA